MLSINWLVFWAIISVVFMAGFCFASLFVAADQRKHKPHASSTMAREREVLMTANERDEYMQNKFDKDTDRSFKSWCWHKSSYSDLYPYLLLDGRKIYMPDKEDL